MYHADQELSEERFRDEESEKPGVLHIMNSYRLVPSERRDENGMPDMPIMTHGVNFFHNAESFRCEIVIATNPGITIIASRAKKVVYPMRYKSSPSYASRGSRNPWASTDGEGEKGPTSYLILSFEDYKDDNGSWKTFRNAYCEQAQLTHQQNYHTFAKAVQAIIEDAYSGALKEKVMCKRAAASHQQGPQSRARCAGGRGGR